jgi:hypothetical protein
MVTLSEPTPDQRQLARTSQVRLVSLDGFAEPILCRTEYQHLRSRYGFGSIADPTGKLKPAEIVRFPTPLTVQATASNTTFDWLVKQVQEGEVVVLLGDFGAGKSLTAREVYLAIEAMSRDGLVPFPVAINLRDHWGQESADELFIRHTQRVGLQDGIKLFQAWKQGFVTLLLDGFDELAPQPWTQDKMTLAMVRRKAIAAVRNILEQRPPKAGILLTGRTHYFPSDGELRSALEQDTLVIAELRELTDDEAGMFLGRFGLSSPVSRWLPRRPLLLSYLAKTGYINEIAGVANEEDVGRAWHKVMAMVCEREARVSQAIAPENVMRILSSLAHLKRTQGQNLGPISAADLESAFRIATDQQPDHDAWAILQRLPGITIRSEGQKWFVDEEWADVLAGLSLADVVLGHIWLRPEWGRMRKPIGLLGRMVAAARFADCKQNARSLTAWIWENGRLRTDPTMLGDVIATTACMDDEIDLNGFVLKDALFGEFILDDWRISDLTLEGCCFDLVAVPGSPPSRICITDSRIDVVEGVAGKQDLPEWIKNCLVECFRFPHSNADVLAMRVPEGTKMGTVVLRKTYLQMGKGRKMSALLRGIDPSRRALVKGVVAELRHQGFLVIQNDGRGSEIVHPVRSRMSEVKAMLTRIPDPKKDPWKRLARL